MSVATARAWLTRLKPVRAPLPVGERVAAWVGALLGLLVTGAVSRPLAQPWSVIGGNFLAALIGVTAARFIPLPLGAAAMAVATTITVTSLLGCPERADLARRNVE